LIITFETKTLAKKFKAKNGLLELTTKCGCAWQWRNLISISISFVS